MKIHDSEYVVEPNGYIVKTTLVIDSKLKDTYKSAMTSDSENKIRIVITSPNEDYGTALMEQLKDTILIAIDEWNWMQTDYYKWCKRKTNENTYCE